MRMQRSYPWLWVILAIGIVLRLAYWLKGESLWLDESYIADNVWHQGFSGVLGHLYYGQSAPVPFIWIEQGIDRALSWFGVAHGEWSLRLWPCWAGIFAMLYGVYLASRYVDRPSLYIIAVLWAFGEPLVLYGSQAKPYTMDILVAVVLWGLFMEEQARAASGQAKKADVLLPVVYAFAILSSFPAAFQIATYEGLVVVGWLVEKDRMAKLPCVGLISGRLTGWLAAVGATVVLYLIQAHQYAGRSDLMRFWSASFLPLDSSAAIWLAQKAWELCGFPMGLYLGWVALPLMVFGFTRVGLFQRRMVLCLLGVGLVASAAHLYPFQGRVILYLFPYLVPVMAAGIAGVLRLPIIVNSFGPGIRIGLLVTLLAVMLWQSVIGMQNYLRPGLAGGYVYIPFGTIPSTALIVPEQPFRPLLQEVADQMEPGDGILTHPSAIPQMEAYADILSSERHTPVLEPNMGYFGARGVGRQEFGSGDPIYAKVQKLPWKRLWVVAAVPDELLHMELFRRSGWVPAGRVSVPGDPNLSAILLLRSP